MCRGQLKSPRRAVVSRAAPATKESQRNRRHGVMERPEAESSSGPSSFLTQAKLAYEYSLKNLLWKQAVFYAERLVAERPCDETTYLLGLAYFHNQEMARAQWHLQGNKLPDARYLLARCCLQMKRWDLAEDALLSGGTLNDVVNGAAGLFLLGQVQERQGRREQAVQCYAKCLQDCPFMWDAYERWSWLVLGSPSTAPASLAATTFSDEKFAQSFVTKEASSTTSRPGFGSHASDRLSRTSPSRGIAPNPAAARNDIKVGLNRRDRRESWHSRNSMVEGQLQKEAPRRPSTQDGVSNSNESLSLASLLCKLGIALHALHSFNCQQAVQELASLPKRHYETSYVLDLVGLSYFESADYKKSETAYNQAWRIEPYRVEGLEYYSSALWHLRRDVELCRLAQQCLQWDRLKPQVWCVVGNCFSLQKEHDAAIKLFKRAIQVDSTFTYAYTLCGHEFVACEKIDKAVAMYENALNLDPRHYNAWWGLGNIYLRQEEHENAKYHFYKALQVNASNSVLRCYLGMVLTSLKQPLLALESFDQAAQAEPQNGMAYFQKACVLMSLDRFDEALSDLKKVRCLAPKEACVHFQLGKVYMKLQKDRKALFHFNIAMDLNRDSKDYHTIKMHIEKLHIRGISEEPTGSTGSTGEVTGSTGSRMLSAGPGAVVVSSAISSPTLYGQSSSPASASREPQPTPVRGLAGGFWSGGSGGPSERRALPYPVQRRNSPLSWGGPGFRI